MFNKKDKTLERKKYFTDRRYRREMMNKKRKSSRNFWTAFLIVIVIAILFLGGYVVYLFQGLPSLSALENPKTDMATRIYSEDGALIDQFYLQNRTAVTLDNIPKDLINALIATEDRKFYKH